MIERCVNHGVRFGCAFAQILGISDIAPEHFRAGIFQRFRARVAARQPKHLMSVIEQLFDDRRTDKSIRSCNKNTHGLSSLGVDPFAFYRAACGSFSRLTEPETDSVSLDNRRLSPVTSPGSKTYLQKGSWVPHPFGFERVRV